MSAATDAFARLNTAMQETNPACQNDGRFILDDQPAEAVTYLCKPCPLFTPCRVYATTARPTAGIWAGKQYTRKVAANG